MTARLHGIGREDINATRSMNTAKLMPPAVESVAFFFVRNACPFLCLGCCNPCLWPKGLMND